METLKEILNWLVKNEILLLNQHYKLICAFAFVLHFLCYIYYVEQLKTRIELEKFLTHLMHLKVPLAASFSRKGFKVDPILGTFVAKNSDEKRLEGADPSSPHLVGLPPKNLTLLAFVFICLLFFVAALDRNLAGLPSFSWSFPYITFSFLCGSLLVWKVFFITEGLIWNRTFLLRISEYNREFLGVPCSVEFSWDSFKIEPKGGSLSLTSAPRAPSPKKEGNVMTNAEGTSCPPG